MEIFGGKVFFYNNGFFGYANPYLSHIVSYKYIHHGAECFGIILNDLFGKVWIFLTCICPKYDYVQVSYGGHVWFVYNMPDKNIFFSTYRAQFLIIVYSIVVMTY